MGNNRVGVRNNNGERLVEFYVINIVNILFLVCIIFGGN